MINTEVLPSSQLCLQLKEILESYFDKHPNISINALAMRSQVGATTLRRILSLSIKGDPSPHTVLNLVSAVSKERQLSKLLSMFDGPIGEMLNQCFSNYVEQATPHTYDRDLNQLLTDKTNYFIYKLAANKCGVTKNEVQNLYGNDGLEKLYEMVHSGHILTIENVFHAKEKDFSLDLMVIKNHLPDLVRFYRPEELDKGLNLFYTMSESLNSEGIKKIKEIQKEAVKKTYEILSQREFQGEIPYFTLQVCDTLMAKDLGALLQ